MKVQYNCIIENHEDCCFSFAGYSKRDSIDEFMEYNSCILLSFVEKMKILRGISHTEPNKELEEIKSLERKQKRKCIMLDFPQELNIDEYRFDEIINTRPVCETANDTAIFRNSEPLPETDSFKKKKHGSFKSFLKRVLSLSR